MIRVEFFEKPGCKGNAKQRARLEELGYQLDVKDMLNQPWTPAALRPFFGHQPIADWFNKGAKKIKSGEVDVSVFADAGDEGGALDLLVADPMLIRRPLLRTEKGCAAGFVPGAILSDIGINIPEDETITEGCQKSHPGEQCKPA